jgi:hypothetical protein
MGKRFHVQNFIESATRKPIAATICWPPISRWRRRTAMPRLSWQAGLWRLRHEAGSFHAAAGAVAGRHGDGALRPARPPYPQAGAASPAADAQGADRAAEGAWASTAMMATELEFFLFEKSFDEIRKSASAIWRRSAATTRITTSSRPPRKRRDAPGPQSPLCRGRAGGEHQGRGREPARKSSTSATPMRARLRRPSHHRQAGGQGDRLAAGPR